MTEAKTAALPRKDPIGLILAGGAGSITGVLPALIAPVYSIWLADVHNLSNTEIGLVQSSLHLVQVVVILLMSPIVDRFNRKVLGVVGALVAIGGFMLITISSGFWMLFGVQFVAGIGAGLAYVGSTSALSYAHRPARAFSIITIAAILVGAAMLIIFPLLNAWSASYGLFVGLAAVVAICLVCFLTMPNLQDLPDARSSQVEQARNDEPRRNLLAFPGFAVVIAYFLINLGLVAVWTFSAQIGVDAGMSDSGGPVFLGVSQVMCIVGVVVAWYVSDKNLALPILIGAILVLSVGKLILGIGVLPAFVVGMLVTNLAFYCVIPYMFAAGSQLDPRSGRLVVLVGASAMVASAIGPTLGGVLAGASDNWFRLTLVAALVILVSIPFAVTGVRAGLKAASATQQ